MRIALMALAAFAACAPAPEAPQASVPATPDSAEARRVVEAFFAEYDRLLVARDAPGVAALFAEDGTATYFGFPTTTGRTAIQAVYTQVFSAATPVATGFVVQQATGVAPGLITALGTNAETVDSAGTRITTHWRWATAMALGADGQWRTAYAIGFPDSVTRTK